MVDKKLEGDIKALNSFLELWAQFHSIYNGIIARDIISTEDEGKFLETKSTINSKYEILRNMFDFKYMPHSRLTDPVGDIMALGSIRFISEKNLKKLNDDWKDSYLFLNNILERLKNKKKRLGQFNPVGVFFKRVLERI